MSKVRALLMAAFMVGLAATSVEAQQFGYQLAFDGDNLLIAEPVDPVGIDSTGSRRSIYSYAMSGGEWVRNGVVMAPEHRGADYFGRAMVLNGDELIVGATSIDLDDDNNGDGNVYVYRKDGNDWELDYELRPESVPSGSSYGRFISVAGDVMVATALGYQTTGGAWIFERGADGRWAEAALIVPSEPSANEFFGWGAHTDGERVIVGAFHGDGQSAPPGAAYIFGKNGSGEWVQEAVLSHPEPTPGDIVIGGAVGQSIGVGVSGDHALLGLPGADNGAGIVVRYERRRTGDWVRTGELAAFDRSPGDQFGTAFHGVDGQLWIAAPGAGLGAIYAFDWNPDKETFEGVTKIEAGEGSDAGDAFGYAVATNGSMLAVGQPGDDSGLGSVVFMRNDGGSYEPAGKLFLPVEKRELTALADIQCSDSGSADQFACDQVDVLSFMPLDAIGGTDRGIQTNDVWGWTDAQTGREYALVGRTDGTSFIDVSDPSAPIYLGNLAKTPGSITNAWRDVKVYDNHAFIVADGAGQHGMQVFDLERLRDVRNAPVEFEPDALYDGIASAHNIVINEEVGRAYAVGSNSGGETCGGGLHMIDISEPLNPTFDGCFQDLNTGFAGTGYSHDAMCMTYDGPDTEHAGKEICFGSNENNLSIADVTDPDNTVAISHASYPGVAYAHQGWITPDGRYFFMNDEGDEGNNQQQVAAGQAEEMPGTRTLIWDVSDLDDPVMVKEHFGETLTIDHNLYIKDNLMYQSNYVSGLRVLDISDPENPVEVGYFDTVPWDESVTFDGSWSNYPYFESGTIVVSSGQEGVFFLKYRRPELVP